MFIQTIMIMEVNSLPRLIFCERAKQYFLDPVQGRANPRHSQVFDLLNVSITFGLYKEVKDMVEGHQFYPKRTWRNMVWKRGWELEDTYWRIERHLHRSLDLLGNVEVEDARHFLIHCQFFQKERDEMFNEICRIDETISQSIRDSQIDIICIILGRSMENVNETVMENIWRIALKYVYLMYRKNSNEKRGIG